MERKTVELECKLSVRDAREARAILDALGVVPRAASDEPVRDVYYDTDDRALLAAGYGFRIRTRPDGTHEATLKSMASRGQKPAGDGALAAGTTAREERTEPVPNGKPDLRLLPDGPLREMVGAAAQEHPLLVLARVTGRRRRAVLEPADGLRVEVAYDRVRLAAGSASASSQEVEVELLAGTRARYSKWLRERLRGLRVRPSDGSKLERALRAARIPIPTASRVAAARLAIGPEPRATTPASTAAAHALGQLAVALNRAMDGAKRGAVEGVHDVRTVSRRLRAVLSAFRDEMPDADREDLRRRLATARRGAGAVRDLDIVREAIESAPSSLTGTAATDALGLAALREALAARRRKERAELSRALASARIQSIADRVAVVAAKIRAHGGAPFAVAGACRLPRAVERTLTRRAAIAGPLEDADAGLLHALRIAAKRARYAAEIYQGAFGGTVARFGESAKGLQDTLGLVQDARAIAAALRSVVGAVPSGPARDAAAKVAAVLVEETERKAKKARNRVDELADAAFSPKALRGLFDHLAKRAATVLRDATR